MPPQPKFSNKNNDLRIVNAGRKVGVSLCGPSVAHIWPSRGPRLARRLPNRPLGSWPICRPSGRNRDLWANDPTVGSFPESWTAGPGSWATSGLKRRQWATWPTAIAWPASGGVKNLLPHLPGLVPVRLGHGIRLAGPGCVDCSADLRAKPARLWPAAVTSSHRNNAASSMCGTVCRAGRSDTTSRRRYQGMGWGTTVRSGCVRPQQ